MANIFTRIANFSRALTFVYKRAQSLDLKRPSEWLKAFGDITSAGVNVTRKESLGISAVYTSAKIIGETLGSLTFQVIQKDDNKRIQVYNNIRYMMASSPDPDRGVTAYNYWVAVGTQLATWGNSYSIIVRNGFTSEAQRILLTMPGDWQIKEDTNGVITYKHNTLGLYNVDDIIHFKINSWEGVVGLSPISTNRETMGLAIKQHTYAGKVYGSKPPGYLTAEGTLNPEQRKNLKDSWSDMTEGDNLGSTPVLTGGLKYMPIMIPPDDAQYIESRKMTKEEIYGIYRIPPTFAQDYEHTPYNTSEQQDLTFMKYTITPYLRNIEQELELKLLPVANRGSVKPLQIRFNIESLLRADFKTRTEGYRVLINNGVLSANDVRQLENMNPIEGGDRYYMPMNMIPIDKIDEVFKDEESRAAYHELIKGLNNGKERLHIRN